MLVSLHIFDRCNAESLGGMRSGVCVRIEVKRYQIISCMSRKWIEIERGGYMRMIGDSEFQLNRGEHGTYLDISESDYTTEVV